MDACARDATTAFLSSFTADGTDRNYKMTRLPRSVYRLSSIPKLNLSSTKNRKVRRLLFIRALAGREKSGRLPPG